MVRLVLSWRVLVGIGIMWKLERRPPPHGWQENVDRWQKEYHKSENFHWHGQTYYRMVLDALTQMTDHHCSFCDDYLLGRTYHICHLVPRSHSPELAYDWNNLYLCCNRCNAAKGQQYHEKILRPDAPDYSFAKYFECDLKAAKLLSGQGTDDQRELARTTIDIFRLNHPDRLAARLVEMKKFAATSEMSLEISPDTCVF